MKITVKSKEPVQKEIDVDFPAYVACGDVFDSGGWYETELKISIEDDDLVRVDSIHEGNDGFELTTRFEPVQDIGAYFESANRYYQVSSEGAFSAKFQKAKEYLMSMDLGG